MDAGRGMSHVIARLETHRLVWRPVRTLACVPGPLHYQHVPFIGMSVWPAHDARGKAIDDQIEARLGRIAFDDRGLDAKLVAFRGGPRQLVEILPKERPRRKLSRFSLAVRRRRRPTRTLRRHSGRLTHQTKDQ